MVTRERGTVISIVSSWHAIGAGAPRRRLRLLVEYDTDEGPAVVRTVTTDRPGLRVGSQVTVEHRSGRQACVVFDDAQVRPWWASAQLVSGLLTYGGFVLLMLVITLGIWVVVNSRADDLLPKVPPSPGLSNLTTPSPETPGPGTPSPGTPSPGTPSPGTTP